MGATDWMIFYADRDIPSVLRDRPSLDRGATDALVRALYPNHEVTATADGSLEQANARDGQVLAAVWPGVAIVSADELGIDFPSRLDRRFLEVGRGRTIYLHAMHSVVDWFAYAVWEPSGQLRRALSLSPDHGIMENIGDPLPFESAYWAGQRPAVEDDEEDEYPFVFHPLDLAEEAMRTLFGFVYEGLPVPGQPDLWDIALAAYSVAPRERRFSFGRSKR
jgi:hypothetical protein